MRIQEILAQQRAYAASGAALEAAARVEALDRLEEGIRRREGEIYQALRADLNKPPFESYLCEVGMTLEELRFLRRHLRRWMRDVPVPTPLSQFPARSFRRPEPYGVVLILAPWNYPFLLSMQPLLGALAAGNTVVLKPSAYAPATSALLARLVEEALPPSRCAVVQGGRRENQALLEERFDYIFFTGSPAVGREVMEKAARHLTPVSLELGGKSPAIVDETADIPLTARRLAFGKFLNSGQTCVAPDYVLVHRSVAGQLAQALEAAVGEMFGADPLDNPDYVRMINQRHFHRVLGLMEGERVLFGGQARDGKIAPTLLGDVSWDSPIMGEEIFGPVLPMLVYDRLEEAIAAINARPKPLALYLFTRSRAVEEGVTRRVSYGGGCINDTIVHLASHHLPFGGVGESGMGSYHGKASFDTFTHYKSILKRGTWLDIPLRYRPYTPKALAQLKRIIK